MIEFTNEKPYLDNGTEWDAEHDGKKIGTLTVQEYALAVPGDEIERSSKAYWVAELHDTDDNLICAENHTNAMPDMEDLAVWTGHIINTKKGDVIDADVKDPYGRKHRIVWRAVEITGHDGAMENLGVRSFIWDSPDDAPIAWKLVNDERGGRYEARRTTVSPQGDISWPVESREVEPGDILEPGDFYIWQHR